MRKLLILALACVSTCAIGQVSISGTVTVGGNVTVAAGSAPIPPLLFTGPSGEAQGVVSTAYTSTACTTVNGTAPVAYSTTSTVPGLTMSTSTCVWSGTPTTAGNYPISMVATDSSLPAKTATLNLTISIASSGPPSGGHNEDCNSSNVWIGTASEPMPSGTPGGNASAPTVCLNTAMANTPSPGSTVTVTAGSCSDLQSKINAAVAGETIVIPAMNGAVQDVFTSCRIQPAAAGNASNWITVETDQLASLPAEGNRVSPAYVGIASMTGYPSYSQPSVAGIYMPKIITSNTGNWVVQFASTAAYWRFIGLEITSPSGFNASQLFQSAAAGPNHIILDRIVCHGGNSPTGTDRDDIDDCVTWNGITYGAIIDSYVYDTHCGGHGCAQSNAVGLGGNSTSASGPIKVTNNFLSSAGEVLFSGGSGATPPTVILPTSDDEVRLNHFYKPLFWKTGDPSYFGTWFELDNCMEMKNAQRLWVEGNIMENSTGAQGTQQGNCIVIGPRNQSSGFSGSANVDASGNVTWVSGTQFQANEVSTYCAATLHCMFVYNSKAYQVATYNSATSITLQLCNNGCPNAGGTPAGTNFVAMNSVAFTAALPGLNPNAVGNDIIVKNNSIHGAARVAAVAIAVSNNGDLPSSLARMYFANNGADYIDGWYWNNDAPGAGSVWGTGIQIMSAPSLNISGLVVDHNTFVDYLTGGKPGLGPDFSWGMKGNTVNYLQVTNNLSTAGVALGSSAEAIITAATPKTQLCWDHNLLVLATNPFGPNGNGAYATGNNAPYPVAADSGNCSFSANGNITATDFNAVDFTAITGNTVNFQLTGSSPGHNAASDGSDIGVNYTTLQNAIAGVY